MKRKIKKAFCPPEVVDKNPIMDYAKNIIFGYYGTMTVNSAEVCQRFCFVLFFCVLCFAHFFFALGIRERGSGCLIKSH